MILCTQCHSPAMRPHSMRLDTEVTRLWECRACKLIQPPVDATATPEVKKENDG